MLINRAPSGYISSPLGFWMWKLRHGGYLMSAQGGRGYFENVGHCTLE